MANGIKKEHGTELTTENGNNILIRYYRHYFLSESANSCDQ